MIHRLHFFTIILLALFCCGIIEAQYTIQASDVEFDNLNGVIINYKNKDEKNIVIPSSFDGINVRKIGDYAFKGNNLTTVILPETISTIGESAFEDNHLPNIDLKNVENIGNSAFLNNSINSLKIPGTVRIIDNNAFTNNPLTEVTFQYGVKKISESAFYNNHLTTVELPHSVNTIGPKAFASKTMQRISVREREGYIIEWHDTDGGITSGTSVTKYELGYRIDYSLLQTIKVGNIPPKTYGDNPFSLNWSASSGLLVNYESSDQTVAMVDGNEITIVGAGHCFITGTQPGDGDYAPAEPVKKLLYVSPKNLAISSELLTKVYDGTNFIRLALDLHGIKSGDEVSLLDNQGQLASINVGKNIQCTFDNTLTGKHASNYNLTTNKWYVNITPKTITVKNLFIKTKVYDGTTSASSYGSETIAGFIKGDEASSKGSEFKFVDKKVGANKTVTIMPKWALPNDNYTFEGIENKTGIISKRMIHVSMDGLADTKEYDGTRLAKFSTIKFSNYVEGDDVGVHYRGVYENADAESDKQGRFDIWNVLGADAINYALPKLTFTGTIAPKKLYFNKDIVLDKVYDGNVEIMTDNGMFSNFTNQILENERKKFTISNGLQYEDKDVGIDKPIVGQVTLNGHYGAKATNYEVVVPKLKASITPKTLTVQNISLYRKFYDGTTEATLATNPQLIGIVPYDDVVISLPEYHFPSKNVAHYDNITAEQVDLIGADKGNYIAPEMPIMSANIYPRRTSLHIEVKDKVYDGKQSVEVVKAYLTNKIAGDEVVLDNLSIQFHDSNVGMNKALQITHANAKGADAPNYLIEKSIDLVANIFKRELTITADDYERLIGEENPVFTVTYDGFADGENESVLNHLPQLQCNAKTDSPAGEYTISVSCREDNNYKIQCIDGTLKVDVITNLSQTTIGFNMYPNPCYQHLTINVDEKGTACIVNLNGQTLIVKNCNHGKNIINVSHLTPGIYILKYLSTNKKLIIHKFMKQ
jgi:hypothetical protein